MVRVAVEHAGLGQGLHKGVDEARRDGGSPTSMPRREGMTLSGRLLCMNGVAVSWPALASLHGWIFGCGRVCGFVVCVGKSGATKIWSNFIWCSKLMQNSGR